MNHQQTLFSLPKQNLPENPSQNFGKRKILSASREQIEMHVLSLDDMIPDEHPARAIWSYVERLDVSKALNKIKTYEGCVGRPAVDPKILVALWLYATIEGIGSARVLGRYTTEHLGFKWICGNVEIERKTISDFRANNNELFDDLLAQGVAILVEAEAVTLKEIAQDGLRVRANVKKGSFRRNKTIKNLYNEAKERVEFLKKELEEEPAKCNNRQKSTRITAAQNKLNRIKEAEENLQKIIQESDVNRQKYRKKKLTREEKDEVRASTTDPDARIMKMPDGSFHPAYNFQYSVDTKSNIIVGVDVVQSGSDGGQMLPMYKQIKKRYNKTPDRYLIDGGFRNQSDIEIVSKEGCKVYMPVQGKIKGKNIENPYISKPNDSNEIAEWRERMGQEESRMIYKRRASTVELVNARLRGCGLYRICVRGLEKAKGIAKMFAVAHNMARSIAFGC